MKQVLKKVFKQASWKRILLTGICICITMLMAVPACAASIQKHRTYPGYVDDIEVPVTAYGDTIKNVKSSSKNLVAAYSGRYQDYSKSEPAGNVNRATISIYAKKAGTYTVSYDVYKKNGKKRASRKIKVFAKGDDPVKKITFAGKDIGGLTKLKQGKLVVKMNSGNTLKKIEIGTNKRKTTKSTGSKVIETLTNYKTVKNGATINLGTKCYYYLGEYGNPTDSEYFYSRSATVTSITEIRITYIDKYTKQAETTTAILERLAF